MGDVYGPCLLLARDGADNTLEFQRTFGDRRAAAPDLCPAGIRYVASCGSHVSKGRNRRRRYFAPRYHPNEPQPDLNRWPGKLRTPARANLECRGARAYFRCDRATASLD